MAEPPVYYPKCAASPPCESDQRVYSVPGFRSIDVQLDPRRATWSQRNITPRSTTPRRSNPHQRDIDRPGRRFQWRQRNRSEWRKPCRRRRMGCGFAAHAGKPLFLQRALQLVNSLLVSCLSDHANDFVTEGRRLVAQYQTYSQDFRMRNLMLLKVRPMTET